MKSQNLYTKKRLISFFSLCAVCILTVLAFNPLTAQVGQVEVQISMGSDDAEENLSSGSVAHNNPDLELVTDGSVQLVGMRFQSLNIPRGARIVAAYIEFECDEANSTATSLTIKGEAIDDAPTFSTASRNISSRTTTSASTPWTPNDSWTVNSKYKTSNFANVVQEIVDRNGWSANNDIAIIISGSGKRVAESYDGESAAAPKLVVVYDNVVNTANLLKYSVQTENSEELFSYDPDPTCSSADWASNWTKFTCPDGFEFEEYDDGSLVAFGTFVGLANTNDRWDAYFRFENKRTWAQWDAMGRMFYQSGAGSCNANHVDWHYYEIDSVASRIIGTTGFDNEGKVSKIRHNPTDYVKGTQAGFGANNQDGSNPLTCQTYDIRGWCNFSGDLNLQCADFGFNIAGYEENNPCLIPNGDFEDDLDYWYTNASSSDAYITTDAYSGNKAARISGEYISFDVLKSPAKPGEAFTFSGYGKKDNGVGWTSIALRFYDKDHNQLYVNASGVESNTYSLLTGGGIAPANTSFVDIQLWKGNGTGNATFDDICLKRIPFPGEGHCQPITNSGFESPIGAEWTPTGSVTQTTDAAEGNYAALIGGGVDGGIGTSFTGEGGKTYKFSVSIKETGSIGWSGMGLVFYDASWNQLSSTLSDVFSSSYQEYELVAEAPAGTAHINFWLSKYGTGDLFVDGVCLQEVFPTEDCTNGKDDDGDGLVDSDDPDCIGCQTAFLTNNGFEDDLTGWSPSGTPTVSSDALSGLKAIELDNSGGNLGFWQNFSAAPGDVITLSAYAKKTGSAVPTIGIQFFNASGNQIRSEYRKINTTDYEEYLFSLMAPATTSSVTIISWNALSNGAGSGFFDDFCVSKYSLPLTTCSGSSCELEASHNNYVFTIDDSGSGHNVLDYDRGDLQLCDNGDGTLSIKGHIVNGRDAAWNPNNATPCGGDDIWEMDLLLFDMQSWEEFQGTTEMNSSCAENYPNLDYWQVSGTLTGKGCNAGRTLDFISATKKNMNGQEIPYRLQIGWGGNSHNCEFGMSTWFDAVENGKSINPDIYANLDYQCYRAMRPTTSCENFVGNPEFDFGTDGWHLATQTGNTATLNADNTNQLSGANAARIDVSTASGTGWHIQLVQRNQTIESGETYTISFDAKAAANRMMNVRIQDDAAPWTVHWQQLVNLTTSSQSFSFDYTSAVNKYGNVRLIFEVGQSTETVYIDNVALKESCENLKEICPTLNSNEGFENAGSISFDTTYQGVPAAKITDPYIIPDWSIQGGSLGNSPKVYLINDSNDQVNNPEGDNFVLIGDILYCIGGQVNMKANSCYEILFDGALFSETGSVNSEIKIEAFAFGSGFTEITTIRPPVNSDFNNMDWVTYKIPFTPTVEADYTMYVTSGVFAFGQQEAGIAIDNFIIRECCNVEVCGNGIDDDGDGSTDTDDPDCFDCAAGLLNNPEFTDGFNGWSGTSAHAIEIESNGNKFARSTTSGGFSQTLAATPGLDYTLKVLARSTNAAGASAGFSFHDASGTKIGADNFLSIINSDFREYFTTVTAPANTATIRIFTYNGSNNTADYDGFCLTEGSLEICGNNIDDDGDGLIDGTDPDCGSNCALTNPNPAFPLDMNGDNTGWIDYNFGQDFILSDNGDGTMQITGTLINGTAVDFGGGSTASSCGSNDSWTVTLTLSDRMNWTNWQAMGGTAYINSNCPGNEANFDYWDVSGTITGTGCNTGRTLSVNKPTGNYRLQIGYGGNSNDRNCEFGFSTWFAITEGGNNIGGDIYAFLDANCYNPSQSPNCSIDISNIAVSNCVDHPLEDVAQVEVTVTWSNAPANDTIELLLNGKTEFINVAGGDVSPYTLNLMVPADGATNIPISVNWKNNPGNCTDSDTFNAPASCSTGEIPCSILYLCGDNKYQDAEPWDHGMAVYLDRVNGSATLTTAATKADANGYGLYDPMNSSTPLSINLDDFDLIVVSPSVGANHANDLVDAMKTFQGGILNMQYTIADDLGISSGDGWVNYSNEVYFDNTSSFIYSNYDNSAPVYQQTRTVYSYHTGIGEDTYLWSSQWSMSGNNNGVFIHYDKNDVLPGISSHGARVQLGYHLDGFYNAHHDNDPIPSLPISWFDPTKHLTERGKFYLEQALILASTECGLEPEICTDGIDNDGDGQIDCADTDCSGTLAVSSSIPVIGCGGGGSQIDLVTTGTLPYTYVWSDMAPTAQWTFENSTNDVSGNANHQNGGQTNTFAYSNNVIQGNYAGEFSGDDYIRYSIDGGFMEVTFSKHTFSGWIKPANLTGIKTILDEGGATNGIALRLNNNRLEGAVRHGGVQVNSNPLTIPADGAWHHVAMVFDEGVFSIYLDGTASTPVTATYSAIGNHSGNGGLGYYDNGSGFGGGSGNYYVGLMDDVRLFIGQALNPNQITDIARNDGDRYHLQDGNYTVTVTNGAHCVDTENETIQITNYVNVTTAGAVAADQSICSGDTPALLTSTTTASGGSGLMIEYQWESSADNSRWTIIGGATALTYQPGALAQTTYYRRGASRDGCSNQIYSNTLTITVADNLTDPGFIIGAEEKCGSYDPTEISSLGAASGGQGGTIEYQWESSTDNSTWANISGAVTESFDPPTITQTTYYRRKARRSSCAAYLISNVVEKTVVNNFNNGGTIGADESMCGSFDPINVMNIAEPSGGANGSVQYRWESRTTGNWSTISGAISYAYDPSTITETTQYRRLARRSPCSNWIYSNTVTKEVVGEPVAQFATAPLGTVCGNVSYLFLASDAGSTSATYIWNFGPYATPSTAGGNGPHSVSFDFPDDVPSTAFDVTLDVVMNGCTVQDVLSLSGKPELKATNILPRHPSTCASNNGGIDIFPTYPAGSDVQVSIDAGLNWEPINEFSVNNIGSGNYTIYLRYADGECSYQVGSISLIEPSVPASGINEDYDVECDGFAKTFSAIQNAGIDTYTWDFGADASPATATGAGPHNVLYSTFGEKSISLETESNNCLVPYAEDFQIIASLDNGGEIASDQFLCADPDPDVLNNVIAASGGGGSEIVYQWQKRIKLNPNVWGAWQDIASANGIEYDPGVLTEVTQYRRIAWREGCPSIVESNVVVVTPSTSPVANGETFSSVCPGQTFAENVSLNDANVQNATYRIDMPATNGTVTIFSDGTFYYDPNTTFCGTDQFTYEVCSDNGTCCDKAVVQLNLTDTEAPQLENIPDDITIHCDEEVPLPPFVRALENCLTVSLGLDEVSTQGIDTCSIYDYEIRRIWTATDYCGNANSDEQKITVEDITAPDIYRIYTLPNGKKMVAGVMENVGEHWKYISLPISFPTKPVIFTQVTSEVDDSTAVVQLRNISSSQFEMRLREEEALDGKHGRESVAWFAIEQGDLGNGEVEELSVSTNGTSIGFLQNYGADPIFLAGLQTTFENDPVGLEPSGYSSTGITMSIREEQSADTETSHIDEKLGYLVMSNVGDLTLASGEVYGEVGHEDVASSWKTINLNNTYHNAVVVATVNSNIGNQPIIRIKNVTATSFDIKLEEWEYENGTHDTRILSYMVVEGSIPFDGSFSCDAIPNPLQQGVEIIAVDNCDLTIEMEYEEVLNSNNCAPDNLLVRTWTSTDECGNSTSYTRNLSVFDNTPPTFTVPADVEVSCLDDIDDLTLTGDVTDESDNCATDLEATYNDIFLTPFTCDSSFTVYREWTLEDGCGNAVVDTQLINIIHQGVSLRLKMFLQGAMYKSPDTLMRDDLRAYGLLPTTEPYTDYAHFLHIGEGGGETVDPAVFDVTGPQAIVDWVFVEIRNATKKDSIIGTRSALMQRDGDIVDIDGFSPLKFNVVQPGSYNVAIRHRNHLGAMTKETKLLTEDPGNSKIDFTKPDRITDIFNESYGWEDLDRDGKIVICHDDSDFEISTTAIAYHKSHGDICGPCGDYATVNNGNWDDPSIWLNGNIPPKNLSNENVRITHTVTTTDFVKVGIGSILWVENGGLIIQNNDLLLNGGLAHILNSDVNIGSNLRIKSIAQGDTKFIMKGGTLDIGGQYFNWNLSESYLENVCVNVAGDYSIGGEEFHKNVCVSIADGILSVLTNGKFDLIDGKFHIINGNFKNEGLVSGNMSGVLIESGNLENTGNWQASINRYCLSGNPIGIPANSIPIFQSCDLMEAILVEQNCEIIDPTTLGEDPLKELVHGSHPMAKIQKNYASWAADLNGDRKTIYQGPSNDINTLFVQVITDSNNTNLLPNYIRKSYDNADLDMDGNVIYQGPDNDRSKLLFDVILRHPGNSQLLPNFIINEQLPR